jgi:transcriptional regulator with XRE-family HTH domain
MHVIIENEFVEFVNAKIEANGWSLRELARRIDMNPSLLSKYLTQKKAAGADQMERILSAFGVQAHLTFVEVEENVAA